MHTGRSSCLQLLLLLRFHSRFRLTLMSRKLLLLCVVLFGSAGVLTGCEPELDLPWVVAADAWCEVSDSVDESSPVPFQIGALVNHDRGPAAIEAVWVDASFVDYDMVDGTLFLTPIGSFDLMEQETLGDWKVTVPAGDTPLDCSYDFDYHFLFNVLDDDGDIARADFIN